MTPDHSQAYRTILNLLLLHQQGKTAVPAFKSAVLTAHHLGLTTLGVQIHKLKIPEQNHISWLKTQLGEPDGA